MTRNVAVRALTGAVVLAVAATTGCGSAGREQAVRNQAGSEAAPAPAASDELLRLLALSRQATYNARFAARSDDEEVSAGEFVVEVWRRGSDVRYDTVSSLANQKARTTTIRKDGAVTRCEQPDGAGWTCEKVTGAAASGFDNLLADVTEQVKTSAVTARDGVVTGRAAHCFTLTSPSEGSREICLTAEGIPVLVSSPSGRFELLNLNRSVAPAVFTPPA